MEGVVGRWAPPRQGVGRGMQGGGRCEAGVAPAEVVMNGQPLFHAAG